MANYSEELIAIGRCCRLQAWTCDEELDGAEGVPVESSHKSATGSLVIDESLS